jgi:plastocyanin
MTIRAKNRVLIVGSVIGVLALAVSLLPMLASSNPDPVRELQIVVRGMAFYVDGGAQPNPAITLRAGEQVRLRVRNEDAGMRHDFAIEAWTLGTRMLEDRGEEDVITFRVPDQRGTLSYQCTPHAKMMAGSIRVE